MSRRSTRTLTAVVAGGALALAAGLPAAAGGHPAGPPGCAPIAVIDFNGDGKADLALGAPYATVGGDIGAGAVMVVLNAHAGPGATVRVVTQDTTGVADATEAG